jgi:hypothetical protein
MFQLYPRTKYWYSQSFEGYWQIEILRETTLFSKYITIHISVDLKSREFNDSRRIKKKKHHFSVFTERKKWQRTEKVPIMLFFLHM